MAADACWAAVDVQPGDDIVYDGKAGCITAGPDAIRVRVQLTGCHVVVATTMTSDLKLLHMACVLPHAC